MSPTIPSSRRDGSRRGVAAVEFAVCLPVLVVLVLGTIECTNMIFVQQSMHVVAYEGIRTAVNPGSLNSDVATRCNQVVAERGLRNVTTTTIPADVTTVAPGQPITMRVQLPYARNSVTGMGYFSNQLTALVVMVKE